MYLQVLYLSKFAPGLECTFKNAFGKGWGHLWIPNMCVPRFIISQCQIGFCGNRHYKSHSLYSLTATTPTNGKMGKQHKTNGRVFWKTLGTTCYKEKQEHGSSTQEYHFGNDDAPTTVSDILLCQNPNTQTWKEPPLSTCRIQSP